MEPHWDDECKSDPPSPRQDWPERWWVAGLLLLGNYIFPGAVLLIASVTETPTGAAIDWRAESPMARLVSSLFDASVCYSILLVAVMRGWRFGALVLGVFALIVSLAV